MAEEVKVEVKVENPLPDNSVLDGEDPIVYSGDETPKDDEVSKVDEVSAVDNTEKAAVAAESDEVDDPRFKGKGKKDIYKSYRELEGQLGHQSNEIGMYRKLFDEKAVSPVKEEVLSDEVLSDKLYAEPSAVLNKVKEDTKREVLSDVRKTIAAHTALNKLEQKHSDRAVIIETPHFKEWVSNHVPAKIFAIADSDPEVADFILSEYKEKTAMEKAKEETIEAVTTKRSMAAKAGTPNASSSQSQGKKIFSRIELGKMMMENPSQYAAMQPEIMKAYQEGRVK